MDSIQFKAVALHGSCQGDIVTREEPRALPSGFARVAPMQVGLCPADVRAYIEPAQTTIWPGCGFVGQVVALSRDDSRHVPESRIDVGDLVTGLAADGGAMAQFVTVHLDALQPLGAWQRGRRYPALLGEPLMRCLRATRAAVRSGDHVVVLGSGMLSRMIVTLLRGHCGSVTVAAPLEEDRELAYALGATNAVELTEATNLEADVRRITDGAMADVTLDTVGAPRLMAWASLITRRSGTLWTSGAHADTLLMLGLNAVLRRGLRIVPEPDEEGARDVFRRAQQVAAAQQLSFDEHVTHVADLDGALALFETAAQSSPGHVTGCLNLAGPSFPR